MPSTKMCTFVVILVGVLAITSPTFAQETDPPNVVVIMMDDVGIERTSLYSDLTLAQPEDLPDMSGLQDRVTAGEFLRFTNAWSNPLCSPTRWTILSGLYAFDTGIGTTVQEGALEFQPDLDAAEVLSKRFSSQYSTAAFGKWHLGTEEHGDVSPEMAGFDHFEGLLEANNEPPPSDIYTNYVKTENGVTDTFASTQYLTEATVDWIIGSDGQSGWLADQGSSPFFMWLAFHAAHSPFHCPPDSLLPAGVDCDPLMDPTHEDDAYQFQRMIEVLDSQIDRLLTALPSDTYVFIASDNGSPRTVAGPVVPTQPKNQAKATVFQGGVWVPLLVKGPSITGGADVTELVNLSDIHDTVLEIGQSSSLYTGPQDLQSQSFAYAWGGGGTPRDCVFTEVFSPNAAPPTPPDDYAVMGESPLLAGNFKYVEEGGTVALFDVSTDTWEQTNLIFPGGNPVHREIALELKACSDQFSDACLVQQNGEPCLVDADCCQSPAQVCVGAPLRCEFVSP